MREDEIKSVLLKLNASQDSMEASALVSIDGLIIAAGTLRPDEAHAMLALVAEQRWAIETNEIEQRIAAHEVKSYLRAK